MTPDEFRSMMRVPGDLEADIEFAPAGLRLFVVDRRNEVCARFPCATMLDTVEVLEHVGRRATTLTLVPRSPFEADWANGVVPLLRERLALRPESRIRVRRT